MPDHAQTIRRMFDEVINDGRMWRTGFPVRATGTHTGDFMGIPATGSTVDFDSLNIGAFRDGRADRHRVTIDIPKMMEQLGLAGGPGERCSCTFRKAASGDKMLRLVEAGIHWPRTLEEVRRPPTPRRGRSLGIVSASQGSEALDGQRLAAASGAATTSETVSVESARLALVTDSSRPSPPVPPRADPHHHFSIVIRRNLGTVVITVHGELDISRAGHLGHILADIIDGQGNLSVVVDLHDATTSDPDSLWVFTDAAERARRRGGKVLLTEPPLPLGEALQLRGLDLFVGSQFGTRPAGD